MHYVLRETPHALKSDEGKEDRMRHNAQNLAGKCRKLPFSVSISYCFTMSSQLDKTTQYPVFNAQNCQTKFIHNLTHINTVITNDV